MVLNWSLKTSSDSSPILSHCSKWEIVFLSGGTILFRQLCSASFVQGLYLLMSLWASSVDLTAPSLLAWFRVSKVYSSLLRVEFGFLFPHSLWCCGDFLENETGVQVVVVTSILCFFFFLSGLMDTHFPKIQNRVLGE